ncbi:MAG: hypothetical protein WC100_00800 [Sterolibacterium sp.]
MGSFSAFHWLIFGIFVFFIVKAFSSFGKNTAAMICSNCGSRSGAQSKVRGSIGIEIVLWLCLIVPGIIYSLWRMNTRHSVCAACGQPSLIPVSTPRGAELAAKFPMPE